MSQSRHTNEGFATSEVYDLYRPTYQTEAVEEFLQVLGIKDAVRACVVDLAAGTGKFTEILAAQPENFEILAVEPDAVMRQQLVKKQLQNVKVLEGTADDMSGIDDASVDALIAAQSFHWFSNMDTLREVHRVLRPTGVFGMIWNIEDHSTVHDGWETTMMDELAKLDAGSSMLANEEWKQVFDEQGSGNPLMLHASDPLFGLPIGEKTMNTEEWLSKQDVWNRLKTYTHVIKLKEDQFKEFEAKFWNAIDAPDTKVDDHGRVVKHSKVLWAWTSKIPTEPLQNGGRPDE